MELAAGLTTFKEAGSFLWFVVAYYTSLHIRAVEAPNRRHAYLFMREKDTTWAQTGKANHQSYVMPALRREAQPS